MNSSSHRVEVLDAPTAGELRQAIEAVQEKLRARGFSDVSHIVELGIARLKY